MKAIEVDGLVKIYGNVRAVNGVTFSVEKDELYALMGSNGSGGHSSALLLNRFSYPMPFFTMRTFLIPLINQINA